MTLSSRNISSRPASDRLLSTLTRICALISAAIIFLIVAFLVVESLPALSQIRVSRFFTDTSWHPLSERYNLLPMITATALTSVGAILLAGPLGVASAIFSRFYAPRPMAIFYQRLVELLAGIPSVVFGLWGLVVLVPIVARLGGTGQSALAAILILALMILPTVALTSFVALRAVPSELIAGGAALGMSRWAVAIKIAIPAAKRGIAVGILLGVSRAIGETMAVLMVAGNVSEFPSSILSPVRTLTANMALGMSDATDHHRSILFISGLILMGVLFCLVLLVEMIGGRRREH